MLYMDLDKLSSFPFWFSCILGRFCLLVCFVCLDHIMVWDVLKISHLSKSKCNFYVGIIYLNRNTTTFSKSLINFWFDYVILSPVVYNILNGRDLCVKNSNITLHKSAHYPCVPSVIPYNIFLLCIINLISHQVL